MGISIFRIFLVSTMRKILRCSYNLLLVWQSTTLDLGLRCADLSVAIRRWIMLWSVGIYDYWKRFCVRSIDLWIPVLWVQYRLFWGWLVWLFHICRLQTISCSRLVTGSCFYSCNYMVDGSSFHLLLQLCYYVYGWLIPCFPCSCN